MPTLAGGGFFSVGSVVSSNSGANSVGNWLNGYVDNTVATSTMSNAATISVGVGTVPSSLNAVSF